MTQELSKGPLLDWQVYTKFLKETEKFRDQCLHDDLSTLPASPAEADIAELIEQLSKRIETKFIYFALNKEAKASKILEKASRGAIRADDFDQRKKTMRAHLQAAVTLFAKLESDLAQSKDTIVAYVTKIEAQGRQRFNNAILDYFRKRNLRTPKDLIDALSDLKGEFGISFVVRARDGCDRIFVYPELPCESPFSQVTVLDEKSGDMYAPYFFLEEIPGIIIVVKRKASGGEEAPGFMELNKKQVEELLKL